MGQEVSNRFSDNQPSKNPDVWLKKIKGKTIIKATLKCGEKIELKLDNNYCLVFPYLEELEVLVLDFPKLNKQLVFRGNGDFYQNPLTKQQTKKIKSTFLKLPVDKDLQCFYREDLPLGAHNFLIILETMVGWTITDVIEETAIAFYFELKGNTNEQRGLISIDSDWRLFKNGKIVLDSKKSRFQFLETLKKTLEKKQLLTIKHHPRLHQYSFIFSQNYQLKTYKDKNKYIWWDFHNFELGILADVNSKNACHYTLYCPFHLEKKYLVKKRGRIFADLMYSLDFYRTLFG
jgi:hypothetical protein